MYKKQTILESYPTIIALQVKSRQSNTPHLFSTISKNTVSDSKNILNISYIKMIRRFYFNSVRHPKQLSFSFCIWTIATNLRQDDHKGST